MPYRKRGTGSRSSHITREGAERLREEFDYLWTRERPKVTQEVADAAAQGDRSENAEYIYGKKRLREIDRRLQFLSKRLDDVTIVDPRDSGDGRVRFGAYVEVENEDGEVVTYRVVGSDEFDVSKGFISMDSPVGHALLGKAVDDEVIVKRPKGDAVYTVLSVRY